MEALFSACERAEEVRGVARVEDFLKAAAKTELEDAVARYDTI
jgi:hypothetical protein